MKTVKKEATFRGFISKNEHWGSISSIAKWIVENADIISFIEKDDGKGDNRLIGVERIEIKIAVEVRKLKR